MDVTKIRLSCNARCFTGAVRGDASFDAKFELDISTRISFFK